MIENVMAGSALTTEKFEASSLQQTRSCPQCGGWLYFEDEGWHCLGCARQYALEAELHAEDKATSPPEQLADSSPYKAPKAIPSEAEREPSSPSVIDTGGARAKTPTASIDSKRRERELGTRQIYRFSVDGFWVSPGEITFRPWEMLFLIKHLPELRDGIYPPDPNKSSSYTEAPVSKGKRHRHTHSYFEIPAGLAGEVEARLEKCGLAGLLLLAHHGWGVSEEGLAKYTGLSVEGVGRKVSQALNYVSGWKRKRDYPAYIRHKRGTA